MQLISPLLNFLCLHLYNKCFKLGKFVSVKSIIVTPPGAWSGVCRTQLHLRGERVTQASSGAGTEASGAHATGVHHGSQGIRSIY